VIGSLRERIELLKPMRTPDEGGGFSVSYAPHTAIAARIEGKRSITERIAEQNFRRFRQVFVIRSREDLLFEMRLRHGGRLYRIANIAEDDPAPRFTAVEAEEIMP
jgi:head-tail adaptor